MSGHKSDCAVHNAPAYEPGPCDCGAGEKFGLYSNEWIAEQQNKIAELLKALTLIAEWAETADSVEAVNGLPQTARIARAAIAKATGQGTE